MTHHRDEKQADYRGAVRTALADEGFLRLTLSNAPSQPPPPATKIVLRPVAVKGERLIQFAFAGETHTTRNLPLADAVRELDALIGHPFRQVHAQTASHDLLVRITRKGAVLMKRTKPSLAGTATALGHDRTKSYPLPIDAPDPFLQAIGVMDENGRVQPGRHAKFRQINEFIRVIEQVLPALAPHPQPLRILDCGCGSAYLTFAAFYYLQHKRNIPSSVTGIDRREDVIAKCLQQRDALQWPEMSFIVSSIADFQPPDPPNLVLSLHACDTATDEALALGVRCGSAAILAAPCCQHELHDQIRNPVFQPVLRHGILRERQADILTDAFRALLLRIAGYRTSIVEFVSPEHTAKNLMIRAESGLPPGDPQLLGEYRRLKEFWNVTPAMEPMLGNRVKDVLASEG